MKLKLNKKKVSIILVLILTVFLTGNAFAALVGAPNIFFAIKDMVVHEEVQGEEKLLLDRDITISYSSIKIKDGVELQINRILIEEEKSTLFITLNNKNNDDEQLGINVYDLLENNNTNDVLAEEKFLIKTGMKKSFEIELDKKVSTTDRLSLEIIIGGKAVGRNIIIDLESKEIIIEGTEAVKKISEVELKKYLGCFSILNHETLKMNDRLLYIAEQMNTNIFKDTIETNSQRELLLNIVDSFYVEPYLTESVNGIEILKANGQQYTYNEESDSYTLVTEGSELPNGLCLSIDNISYKSGIYTVEFIYVYPTIMDIEENKIQELEQYKATIEIELNTDTEYSKYKVLKLSEGVLVKESEKIEKEDISLEIDDEKEDVDLEVDIKDENISLDIGADNKENDLGIDVENEYVDFETDDKIEKEESTIASVEFSTITAENYGDKINYSVTVNGTVLDNWKLFYNDKEQKIVYMIYGDYLDNSIIDLSEQGMVNTESKAVGLKNEDESRDILYTNLTQTAYWYDLLNDRFKSKAIATSQGAPNLDIFVKSWNEKGYKKLYTKQEDMGIGWGLKVGDNPNPTISQVDLLNDNGFSDSLYFPYQNQNVGGASAYWLSTPAVSGQNAMMIVEKNGMLNFAATCFPAAYRPVISFESDLKGYQNVDGSWSIDY